MSWPSRPLSHDVILRLMSPQRERQWRVYAPLLLGLALGGLLYALAT
jgi:hypothetical protein